jgi:hypothetical protein
MKRPTRGSLLHLSELLHRQLDAYALAAGAAGVSLLALAQPSEAKIIYRRVHQVIGKNGVFELDLNQDGTPDFLIQESGTYQSTGVNALFAEPALGNGVQGSSLHNSGYAAALGAGATIGPRQDFVKGNHPGAIMDEIWATHHSYGTIGQWNNVKRKYLGLQFRFHGRTHYGWARLNVQAESGFGINGILTGYAYETVPNKAIHAGQTSDKAGTQQTSLGVLALGSIPDAPRRRLQ